jgi:hypothetical protein
MLNFEVLWNQKRHGRLRLEVLFEKLFAIEDKLRGIIFG